jgi:hypothetical protein
VFRLSDALVVQGSQRLKVDEDLGSGIAHEFFTSLAEEKAERRHKLCREISRGKRGFVTGKE